MHDVVTSHAVNIGHTDLISAVFCDEFEIGVDHDALELIGAGDIARWISDLRSTSLFLPGEIAAIECRWATDPAGLVAALLGEVDEVAQRRTAHLVAPADDVVVHAAVG